MPGRKANLSQRAQELCAAVALQGAAPWASCGDGLGRAGGSRSPRCPARYQQRLCVPQSKAGSFARSRVRKSAVGPESGSPACVRLCRRTSVPGAIASRWPRRSSRPTSMNGVNTCNMLLHQVRQRRQVREELQRRLQQLQDAAMPDKRQQAQAQAICQLEKNIEKVLLKVHTGQKVTALYLVVRDVLRKELAHLPPHLDLLCKMAELYGRELQDMDLMALEACKAADRAKEDANRTRSRILAERARMYRSRATREVSVDTGWRKDVYQRHLRAQERHELIVDSPTPASQDQLVGTSLEAVRSQMEHEARVTQKMQQAKAALQCSRIWDIPGRLLEQQKSSADLEQCIKEGEEKKRALAERLHELELNLAKLKFHQPSNTSRVLEEELRLKLQCQEARLEDMRAQMMRSKDVLLKCEEDIDSLFVRLQGITVPGQEDPVKAMAVEEKLQHCEQKLRYLVQRVASLPHDWRSPNKDNKVRGGSIPAVAFGHPHGAFPYGPSQASSQLAGWRWRQGRAMEQLSPRWHGALQGVLRAGTSRWGSPWLGTPTSPSASNPECLPQIFAEVRNLLENTTADHPQNLRVSLEDAGSGQESLDSDDESCGLVLTREGIKKQGLLLMKSKQRGKK
ncbi:coiled-coil domain-containing protein 183-like isoform X3 [Falco peregrinus]|uniref:coiled-coil domain-containing protein 183-like isoform X3 n=1 Tax=Falco peregrinus TaxID=8954 RepID=UPI00247A65C4|nr:coiled-coil domain-containing protein 183-like isoform X3 [Falco peregrinus]